MVLGIAAAALAAWVASPALASESPRFGTDDILESLDAFVDHREHMRRHEGGGVDMKIDFSFRGDAASEEPGFLYLREVEDPPLRVERSASRAASGFTPRLSAIDGLDRSSLDATGRPRTSGSFGFTPRYAGSEISFSYAPGPDPYAQRPMLAVSLSSEVLVEPADVLGPYDGMAAGLTALDRRSVNLGLSVDYLGFRLGASVTREDGGLASGYEGVDVGFGYAGAHFSTAISVGEYTRVDPAMRLVSEDNRFYKLELGAAYAISERLRLSGGVRLFDYGANFDPETAERAGLLYLGTRLNF